MNKVFLFLFFMFLSFSFGKDTLKFERKFKENTYEKYTNKDFNYQEKAIADELTFWEKVKQWLAEFFQRLFGGNEESAFNFTGNFLNFMAIVIILIVVYIIVKALINKEGGWLFSSKGKSLVNEGLFVEDIHDIDFKKEIEKAKKEGNHRSVIRFYYLLLLKTLADKNLIKWDKDKTNADYLYELKDNQIKSEFDYLSYLYNYTWYGVIEIAPTDFDKMNQSFESALKTLDK